MYEINVSDAYNYFMIMTQPNKIYFFLLCPELLIKLVLLNTKQDTSFLKLVPGFELQAFLSPSIRHLQATMLSCSFSFVM